MDPITNYNENITLAYQYLNRNDPSSARTHYNNAKSVLLSIQIDRGSYEQQLHKLDRDILEYTNKKTTTIIEEDNDLLNDALFTTDRIHDTGSNVLGDLENQREQLLNVNNRLEPINTKMKDARRMMTSIGKNLSNNLIVGICVALFVIFVIIIVVVVVIKS